MKIRNIITALALLACVSASADYDLNAAAEAYNAEVAASIEKMNGNDKHNAGPEPFKEFIARFSTDEDFMNSRIALDDASREKYSSLLTPDTFTAKMPVIADNEGTDDIYYQVWDEMQFHTVHLNCCWDGVLDHNIIFTRKDGKWYLDTITD
ncbi:MAG: hypothetical protein HDS54_01890 [Barnesiella sp.]|nr:hypothetical protein [Barnesiella sp.]